MIKKIFLIFFIVIFINQVQANEDTMIMRLKDGKVIIESNVK